MKVKMLIGGTLILLLILYQAFCKNKWETITLSSEENINDVIAINLFRPFDIEKLSDVDCEKYYGAPEDTGILGKGEYYKEYVGYYGRIRIVEGVEKINDGDYGAFNHFQYYELYTGNLYLEDVIRKKYLKGIKIRKGKWKISVGSSRYCYITLELNGRAVKEIYWQ